MMRHTYSLTIPSYLCGPDDQLGLDGMAGIFQEGAYQHARRLGVAFTEEDTEVFWALHRLGVQFHRRPRWGEEITVETWPSRLARLFAMREFTVFSTQTREPLVTASTAWMILRVADSRPARPERHFPQGDLNAEYPLDLPLGRLPAIPDEAVAGHLADARWLPVRPSDTDRNTHVNNARYAQWFADEAPGVLERVSTPGHAVVLSFTAETRSGQEYAVITDEDSIAEIRVRDPGEPAEQARCACRLVGVSYPAEG